MKGLPKGRPESDHEDGEEPADEDLDAESTGIEAGLLLPWASSSSFRVSLSSLTAAPLAACA